MIDKTKKTTQNELILRQMVGAERLHRVGNSYMAIVPKKFLKTYGELIDGSYWARLSESEDVPGTMLVAPVKMADVQIFDNSAIS